MFYSTKQIQCIERSMMGKWMKLILKESDDRTCKVDWMLCDDMIMCSK